MEQIKTKCNGCRCWREATAFIKNDKVMKTCNVCSNYRENHKKECKKNYEVHTDKVKKYNQEYYIENKEKLKNKRQPYSIEKKEHQQQYDINRKLEYPLKVKIKNIIRGSKESDKKNNRTYNEEDYITRVFLMSLYETQQGKCFYENCNCEMTLDFNKSCRTPTQISIQRLDNEIAHIKSNCVFSCFFCNVVKRMENCEV
tara:strand:- start:46 stop:645 length:600 start_codon:yes stop_codon:yes gene_type:complete